MGDFYCTPQSKLSYSSASSKPSSSSKSSSNSTAHNSAQKYTETWTICHRITHSDRHVLELVHQQQVFERRNASSMTNSDVRKSVPLKDDPKKPVTPSTLHQAKHSSAITSFADSSSTSLNQKPSSSSAKSGTVKPAIPQKQMDKNGENISRKSRSNDAPQKNDVATADRSMKTATSTLDRLSSMMKWTRPCSVKLKKLTNEEIKQKCTRPCSVKLKVMSDAEILQKTQISIHEKLPSAPTKDKTPTKTDRWTQVSPGKSHASPSPRKTFDSHGSPFHTNPATPSSQNARSPLSQSSPMLAVRKARAISLLFPDSPTKLNASASGYESPARQPLSTKSQPQATASASTSNGPRTIKDLPRLSLPDIPWLKNLEQRKLNSSKMPLTANASKNSAKIQPTKSATGTSSSTEKHPNLPFRSPSWLKHVLNTPPKLLTDAFEESPNGHNTSAPPNRKIVSYRDVDRFS